MQEKDGKYIFGVVKVGDKGQIVIPRDARKQFASYMTQSSYGIYIVHYLIIAILGYILKVKTNLHPACIYITFSIAVFTLSPLLYEIIKRIPFIDGVY